MDIISTQLKELYKNDFKMGAAVNTWQLEGQRRYKKARPVILSQFDSITMENQMKPEKIMSRETIDCGSETDIIINKKRLEKSLKLAKDNNLKLRGHCLVWHSQTPDWFFREGYDERRGYADKAVMKQRMENYIREVLTFCQTNYPGVVYAWDVVNEAANDDGTMRTHSKWYDIYKDSSYVEEAFTFARKYASKDVSLFYNDYNEYMIEKRDYMCSLAKDLYDKGLLDGVGMQSHYLMDFPTIDLVGEAIQKYNSIAPGKIEIQLTELDIHNTSMSEESQRELAKLYGSLMKLLLNQKRNKGVNITSVTFWGLTDRDSWLSDFRGETSYPLLFDDEYAEKLCYEAVAEAATLA